jgi:hypothetical protein
MKKSNESRREKTSIIFMADNNQRKEEISILYNEKKENLKIKSTRKNVFRL